MAPPSAKSPRQTALHSLVDYLIFYSPIFSFLLSSSQVFTCLLFVPVLLFSFFEHFLNLKPVFNHACPHEADSSSQSTDTKREKQGGKL